MARSINIIGVSHYFNVNTWDQFQQVNECDLIINTIFLHNITCVSLSPFITIKDDKFPFMTYKCNLHH